LRQLRFDQISQTLGCLSTMAFYVLPSLREEQEMVMIISAKARRTRWIHSAVLALILLTTPALSFGGIFVSVAIAPPLLPVYTQPLCPGPGFIWTPGYWAYGPNGYYWVPGVWVSAPFIAALWTPGYWGWSGGLYLWHPGYWGHHVGFYGGVNYGFGYFGVGYSGGYWHNGVFAYNRAVSHVNVTRIHNTYSRTVINNTASRVSYNGGTGGTRAQPTAAERMAEHESHTAATAQQARQEHAASANRAQLASVNHGNPAVTASAHPASQSAHRGAASSHAAATHSTAHNSKSAGSRHANAARPQRASHASNAAAPYRSAGHAQSASHASGGGHAARGRRS
jgi:hypothetical protein